jgi:hypothetical protein
LVTHRTICHQCNLERKRKVAARIQSTELGAVYNRTTTANYRLTPNGRARLLMFFAARRAKDYGFEFSIPLERVILAIEQGFCEVTKLPFDLKPSAVPSRTNPWAPSLDRRDSTKGYTPDNVQVVCAAYNYAKNEFSTDVLMTLARAIVDKVSTKA